MAVFGNVVAVIPAGCVVVIVVENRNAPLVAAVGVVPAPAPATAPMVPVHKAPRGQQATWLALSAEQMAVLLQQAEGAPRLVQAL